MAIDVRDERLECMAVAVCECDLGWLTVLTCELCVEPARYIAIIDTEYKDDARLEAGIAHLRDYHS